MRRVALMSMLLVLVCVGAPAEPVSITAADGVKVFGEFWPAAAQGAPLILAFHQAGSSHAEYAPLARRLNPAGFSVLAIDQRSGGGEFGGSNGTVATLGRSTHYDAALADLEAALVWGRARADATPLLVWGSSYSAALVFVLAARHPSDIQALLAFSPGEYLDAPDAVHAAARAVQLPVFIDQSSDSGEIEQSRSILMALPGTDKTQFIGVRKSVHGSATLWPDRNPAGAEENWAAVLKFLARFKPSTSSTFVGTASKEK